jgi:hypothetical protein
MHEHVYVHSNSRAPVEVEEPIPEEESNDLEEPAWKRQRSDKSGNRNRSAGSKGEGKHNSLGKRGFRWMQRRLHDNRRAHRGTIVYRIPVALFKKGGKEQYVHTHVNG